MLTRLNPVAVPAALIDAANSMRATGPLALVDHALASGSPLLRDVLILRATRGAADWAALRALLLDGRADRIAVLAPTLVSALRVVRAHAVDDDDVCAVHLGAVLAYHRWPVLEFDSPARRTLIELLLDAGERRRASKLLGLRLGRGAGARLVALDLVNPFTGAGGDAQQWARRLAALHTGHGLEPVWIAPIVGDNERLAPVAVFDRLRCDASPGAPGPLVSVVLAVRDPGPELVTAVESIIAQTHTNWELIIIDDGSGPAADAALHEVVGRDNRIRLIRHEHSAGPYRRRNEGMCEARGDVITFHDADDWSHPRRLERQLAPLLAARPPLATVCSSLRVTDRLEAVHGRGRALRVTESSIMFGRERAIRLVGFFDAVRRAADSGYRLRLQSQGEVRVVDPDVPLSLVRYRPTTLSGTDLRDGWTHPARVAYADAHAHWLGREVEHERAPFIGFRTEHRPFVAPRYIVKGLPAEHVIDLLIVADARAHAAEPVRRRLEGLLAVAAAREMTVALLHAAEPALGHATGAFSRPVRDSRESGTLVDVVPGDRVEARRVIVLSTAVALSLGSPYAVVASECLLVVDLADRDDAMRVDAAEAAVRLALVTDAAPVVRISPDELAAEIAH